MSKTAIRYLETDSWAVEEKGFHRQHARVSESIFSLANEFMGVRGYFEEGYSGESMLGSYFNGIFERMKHHFPYEHRGLALDDHQMVNSVDWLYLRLTLDGETLDLARSKFSSFKRRLDLRTGVLTREFIWQTSKGKKIKLVFERFTSMDQTALGCQRVCLEALNFSGKVQALFGLDFSIKHYEWNRCVWETEKKGSSGAVTAIQARAPLSGHRVWSGFRIKTSGRFTAKPVASEKFIGRKLEIPLRANEPVTIDKFVVNQTDKRPNVPDSDLWRRGMELSGKLSSLTYDEALERHSLYWTKVWQKLDITVDGDPADQQGVRFCIFQLHQTYHGVDAGLNVAAKGLTGEGYGGKAWWDTETYCLSFYIFNNPQAARNLLGYRYRTLPQAVARAPEVDNCEGARYPMCTIDGSETCFVWQHGDLEIHVSAAVAYGLWHYVRLTQDYEFLHREGIEILLQVCRYYASRGDWSQGTGEYGFWCVMGPDEHHMMVHNNAYTNYIVKKIFEYTASVCDDMKRNVPAAWARVSKKVKLRPEEPADWRKKASKMRLNYNDETKLFEQQDGFFDLPHFDPKSIKPEEMPLWFHWAYLRMYRYDMIKQPDVLLLLLLFSQDHSLECKKANYEYYEPRCDHESSLSPGIHSILAAEIGRHEEAYSYFGHATRLDLDDYNRNTAEGLHTTSMCAAWMNIVYGFGGLRSDGERLVFNPSLPSKWNGFSFRLLYRGALLEISVDRNTARFSVLEGPETAVEIYGRKVSLTSKPISVPLLKTDLKIRKGK